MSVSLQVAVMLRMNQQSPAFQSCICVRNVLYQSPGIVQERTGRCQLVASANELPGFQPPSGCHIPGSATGTASSVDVRAPKTQDSKDTVLVSLLTPPT